MSTKQDGLGPILFQRDESLDRTTLVGYGIVLVCLGIAATIFAVFSGITSRQDRLGLILFLGLVVSVFLGIIVSLVISRVKIFRCHLYGVCYITTFSKRELHYSALARVVRKKVYRYANDTPALPISYTANFLMPEKSTTITKLWLTFELQKPSKGKFTYFAEVGELESREFDSLVDFLTEEIESDFTSRAVEEIRANQPVEWVPGYYFRGDTFQYPDFAPPGFGLIPLTDLTFEIQGSCCCLFRTKGGRRATGERRSFDQISSMTTGYFRGLAILYRLSSA